MVEVFITNIRESVHANSILTDLKSSFPELYFNFDLSNTTNYPFPCGHSILRIKGSEINSANIISEVSRLGFICEILQDKICK